ncbi:hypothetical protein [Streptomyces alboflavus]|uniref:hypothetical protein n=1 Tax=Streptomyces alboflavus TaxID=67267 RepID=UPI0013314660|nr:hypothetical protein [Streptomyces alboflavus]
MTLDIWVVWGDSSDPIAMGMTEREAKEVVDRLHQEGRTEVYADCDVTGETYEG